MALPVGAGRDKAAGLRGAQSGLCVVCQMWAFSYSFRKTTSASTPSWGMAL